MPVNGIPWPGVPKGRRESSRIAAFRFIQLFPILPADPFDANLDNLPKDSHSFPAIREIICRFQKKESGPTVNQEILASNLAQREK